MKYECTTILIYGTSTTYYIVQVLHDMYTCAHTCVECMYVVYYDGVHVYTCMYVCTHVYMYCILCGTHVCYMYSTHVAHSHVCMIMYQVSSIKCIVLHVICNCLLYRFSMACTCHVCM